MTPNRNEYLEFHFLTEEICIIKSAEQDYCHISLLPQVRLIWALVTSLMCKSNEGTDGVSQKIAIIFTHGTV